MEYREDELQVDHDRSFDNDLDDDTADEESDGTELADISALQTFPHGGPASSVNVGIQLIQVRPDLARSVPYGDIEMGWLAESVELAAESPEAYAHAVAQWIKSSIGAVTDAVEDLTSRGDFDEEMLEEIEDNTSVTVYISAACPQQGLKAEFADFNREHVQVVWLGEQA
jgi:hypothetical protein